MKRIYLTGRMTGLPGLNFPRLRRAALAKSNNTWCAASPLIEVA